MNGQDYNNGQFITVDEAINSLLSREKDIAGVNKLHYKELAKDVFNAMNLSAIKQTRRILYTIDPRLHSITFPEEYWAYSSISVINHDGKIEPLTVNTDIIDDVVDLGLDNNCERECDCTDALCNYSKHYETITEDVSALMPDNTYQDFTKIIRKFINKNGSAYMEVTEPVASYNKEGTHISTELKTSQTFLCKLQVKPCGCIINNTFNCDTWAKFGSSLAIKGPLDIPFEWGHPGVGYFQKSTKYNISDDGKRIIFPSNFPYKKVLVRIYVTSATKNLLIPYIAKEPFLSGIKRLSTKYDPKAPDGLKERWKANYNADMTVLRLVMNRLNLTEYFEYYFGINTTQGLYFNNNYKRYDDDGYYYPY